MSVYIGATKYPKRTLPEGFARLEYIKSSGTQYIDTGFKPNQNTRVVCEITCPPTGGNWMFGARVAGGNSQFGFVYSTGGYYLAAYNTTQTQFATSMNSSEKLTIDANKATTTLTSNGKTASVTGASGTFSTGYNLILFGCSTAGTISKGTGAIYSFQIYDDGTLVRNFIPCTNAAGTAGLYDTVGSKFYANAGTGSFAVGAVVEEVLGDPVDNIAHKVSKIYIGIGGVAKKVKKAYIGDANGLARLCYSPFIDPTVAYSGNHTNQVVTMGNGKKYRLLTLTSTGTLTLDSAVNAEVWLCGGGNNGGNHSFVDDGTYETLTGGSGGKGGGFYQYETELPKSLTVTIGAGNGGVTSVGSVKSSGHYSGAGGGGGSKIQYLSSVRTTAGAAGAAASKSTQPFEDSYFTKLPCAGGGGGQACWNGRSTYMSGGSGGSSNKKGSAGVAKEGYSSALGGAGGATGGGKGAYGAESYSGITKAAAATYYGSGGGGGASHDWDDTGDYYVSAGANGYQGVVFIRIPLE